MQIRDQIDRIIHLPKTPKRIVSMVPSQTELLVDLGLQDQLVGLTKFCVHPENIRREKTIIGGTKKAKIDKIKALAPDIILCNKEENTQELVAALQKIAPVHVSDIYQLDDTYTVISQYGEIFSVQKKAEKIITEIKKEHQEFRKHIAKKPQHKVAYFIWKDPWMVAAGNTFIDCLLQENKFENVYGNLSRYPEVQLDELKDLDLVLLSSEPFPFGEKHKVFFKNTIAEEKIKLVDGEYFSWYGSRLRGAFHYFKILHQNIEKRTSI